MEIARAELCPLNATETGRTETIDADSYTITESGMIVVDVLPEKDKKKWTKKVGR